jgi:hypothetical protein
MIVAPDFVWLHFPKCAGTAIESALALIYKGREDIVFDPIDQNNVIWHHTINEREIYDPSFRLGNRLVISCIRRLPHWVLSKAHFEAARPPKHLVATREMLINGCTYEADGAAHNADVYAQMFSNPRVDRWIRVEHLVEDLSEALNLPESTVQGALAVKNKIKIDYLKDIRFWFTQEEVSNMYAVNPIWAAIERKVYGSTL